MSRSHECERCTQVPRGRPVRQVIDAVVSWMAENASMNKTLTVALALGAGLLGGLLTRYIAPPATFAQDHAPITKEIRAQSFPLVDSSDQTLGVFTTEPASRAINPYPGG